MILSRPSPAPLRWGNRAAKRHRQHLRPPKLCPMCPSVSPPVPGLSARKDRIVPGVPGYGSHCTYVRARILFISEAGVKVRVNLTSIRIVIAWNGYMDTNVSLQGLRRIQTRHMPDTAGTRSGVGGTNGWAREASRLSFRRWVLPRAPLYAVTRRAGDAYK